jgi:hypothetical protein
MSGNASPAKNLSVFLCHGSEDKATVREIYSRLRQDGVRPWLDSPDVNADGQLDVSDLGAVLAPALTLASRSGTTIPELEAPAS